MPRPEGTYRVSVGDKFGEIIDLDWREAAEIENGVIGIDICTHCGRTSVAHNGNFGMSGCFRDHPMAPMVHYVAIPASVVKDQLPENWQRGVA